MKNDMPEEIYVVIDPRDGCTIWRDNNNGAKYIRADIAETKVTTIHHNMGERFSVVPERLKCEGRNACGGCYPGACLQEPVTDGGLREAVEKLRLPDALKTEAMGDSFKIGGVCGYNNAIDHVLKIITHALQRREKMTDVDNALRDLHAIINGSTDVEHDCHVYIKKHGDTIYKALKSREKVAEVTEEMITDAYSPTPVFKEAFIQIVRWLQDKYPNGIKIVDGGA